MSYMIIPATLPRRKIIGSSWEKLNSDPGIVTITRSCKNYDGGALNLPPRNGYWCEEKTGQITVVNMRISRYTLLKHYRQI